MKETPTIKGVVTLQVFAPDGTLKDERIKQNAITNAGFDLIAGLMGNPVRPTQLTHIGIGYGLDASTAFDATQTDLQGASTYRKAGTYTHTNGTKTFTLDATWGPDEPIAGEVTIEESACFNDAAAGTMFNRTTFAGVTKQAADSVKVIWTFTMAQG